MTAPAGAVIFDLDDTLYAERHFALSGFRQVAHVVAAARGVTPTFAFAVLVECLRRGKRAEAFQTLCATLGYSVESIPALVDVYRSHTPSLSLPRSSARLLCDVRRRWRIAIVTNGEPDVQRRKIAALNLEPLVDAVVYACEHGSGIGKPEPAPFLTAADRLDVPASRCVFVGDDPTRDVAGARGVGMRTIRIARGPHRQWAPASNEDADADAVTATMADIPRLVHDLLTENSSKCA
jgi:putative hydrolase of the HAD superfamily